MRYTSHLLVIWEAKSRILFSKYSQTMLLCKDVGIFEVCIRRSPNTYDGRVDFVALDLGQGILRSLRKRVDKQMADFIQNKDNCQVLEDVFNRYYGSRSNDSNRNQGLPFIKGCNTKNVISQLHVITNNVLLDFSNQSNDKSFASYNNGLIGTLYSWSVYADCITQ